MVVWLLMVCPLISLTHSAVQMLSVGSFYSNAHTHHICGRGQGVVGSVDMGLRTFASDDGY